MAMPFEEMMTISSGDRIPVLILVDKHEFFRLKLMQPETTKQD